MNELIDKINKCEIYLKLLYDIEENEIIKKSFLLILENLNEIKELLP